MTIADILERAAERLSKPGAWTQEAPARCADGSYTFSRDAGAVCWCAMGAIHAEGDERGGNKARRYFESFLREDGWSSIPGFNDDPRQTQESVVTAMREAAALAREQSK